MSFTRPTSARDNLAVRPENGQTAPAGFTSRHSPPVRFSLAVKRIHKVKVHLDSYYYLLSANDLWRQIRDQSRTAHTKLSARFADYESIINSLQIFADQLQVVDSQLRLDGQCASHLDEAPFMHFWQAYTGASKCIDTISEALPLAQPDGSIAAAEQQRCLEEIASLARSCHTAYISLLALQERLIEEIKVLVKLLADELPDLEDHNA